MHRTGCAVAMLLGLGPISATTAATGPQPAVWQDHHINFDYFAVTSRYTCYSLEFKVRQILLFVGARPDAQVRATGCPGGPESLSRSAWVRIDFSTLALAPPGGASDQVTDAVWTPLELASQRPYFMSDGDCELIHKMRKVLTDNFSWRGSLDYRTQCPINTTQFHDYRVQGEVLKAGPVASR